MSRKGGDMQASSALPALDGQIMDADLTIDKYLMRDTFDNIVDELIIESREFLHFMIRLINQRIAQVSGAPQVTSKNALYALKSLIQLSMSLKDRQSNMETDLKVKPNWRQHGR